MTASSPAEDSRPNRVVYFAALFLVLLAVINVCSLLTERLLDWEEYRIVENIRKPLTEHLASNLGYGAYHKLSHWITYRLFDGRVLGFRFFSIITGIASVLLAGYYGRKILRIDALAVVCLFIFGLGWFLLEYARWGVAGYSAATVFYLVTFYAFWKVSDSTLDVYDKVAVVFLCAIGVFVLFHTAIAIAVGTLAVIATHIVRSGKDWRGLWAKVKALMYFGTYPLVTAAVYVPLIVIPRLTQKGHVHSAESYRSFMYFAHNYTYERTVWGALRFYKDHLHEFLFWLVRPVGDLGHYVGGGLVVLFLIGLVATFIRRDKTSPRFFISIYVLIALALLIVLNLVQLYPFGNPRYGFFLYYPVILLSVYGVYDIAWVFHRLYARANRPLINFAVVGLCALAVVLSVQEANRRLEAGNRVKRVLGMIRGYHDLVLVEPRYWILVPTMEPKAREHMAILRSDDDGITDPTFKAAVESLEAGTKTYVLTVGVQPRLAEYPDVFNALTRNYVSVKSENLYTDPRYKSIFHRYNIHAVLWRLRDPALDGEVRLLPVIFGNNQPRIADTGELVLRGWILAPLAIDRVTVTIGDESFSNTDFRIRRPDVADAYPEYQTRRPGFEFRIPYDPALEGKDAHFQFFGDDELIYERTIPVDTEP